MDSHDGADFAEGSLATGGADGTGGAVRDSVVADSIATAGEACPPSDPKRAGGCCSATGLDAG
jgi:hypothetical protein